MPDLRLAALGKPDAWSFIDYHHLFGDNYISNPATTTPLLPIAIRLGTRWLPPFLLFLCDDPTYLWGNHTKVALIRLEITGSQVYPILGSPKVSPARYRPDPPRRSFPWQARRPPQEPRPGRSPRHRPLQDQRRSSAKSQLPIRHRHLIQGRHLQPGRCQDRGDLSAQVLHR